MRSADFSLNLLLCLVLPLNKIDNELENYVKKSSAD